MYVCISGFVSGCLFPFIRPVEPFQVFIVLELGVGGPAQTLPCNLDICPDVFDKLLLTRVIPFRPDETEHDKVHVGAIKIMAVKIVHDVHLDTTRGVFVDWVPANGHDHRMELG